MDLRHRQRFSQRESQWREHCRFRRRRRRSSSPFSLPLMEVEASVLMQRMSYPTETVLSNKIIRIRIVLSFKDSPRKPLGRRPLSSVGHDVRVFLGGRASDSHLSWHCQIHSDAIRPPSLLYVPVGEICLLFGHAHRSPNPQPISEHRLLCIQGGPSGRRTLFVGIKLKVPLQFKFLILKRNSFFNDNIRLSLTGWTTLYFTTSVAGL